MTPEQLTITKLDPHDQPKASYPGDLIFRDGETIVVRCLWVRPGVLDLGLFRLEQDDIFIEYYYPHEWFNIFQIHSAAGALKGWYCNITRPARLSDHEIQWRDLALDLLILPDGQSELVDTEEFEALNPTPQERAQAERAVETLRRWVQMAHPPFDPASRVLP